MYMNIFELFSRLYYYRRYYRHISAAHSMAIFRCPLFIFDIMLSWQILNAFDNLAYYILDEELSLYIHLFELFSNLDYDWCYYWQIISAKIHLFNLICFYIKYMINCGLPVRLTPEEVLKVHRLKQQKHKNHPED